MPPAHFAITEVLIVFTSIYSVYLLKNRRDFFALIGIILIGLAATLGSIRFGLSSGETIIKLNTILGIYSGLTCIGLISVQMAYNLQWKHIYKLLLTISKFRIKKSKSLLFIISNNFFSFCAINN